MFIKQCKTKNKKTKAVYTSHKLVQSYRDNNGKIKHKVILSLGTLELPKIRWKELASILECRISGQLSFLEDDRQIAGLADDIMKHNQFIRENIHQELDIENNADIQPIDLNSTTSTAHRSLGPELVGNAFWEKLSFDNILENCKFNQRQISVAKAIILGRLIYPGSEYSTWQWFKNMTSLTELTSEDISDIGKDSFYEIGDLLLQNKEKIEKDLLEVESNMFLRENNVLLFDLTNTYFEGNCKNNTTAKRGHSKEKRTDCPLVTLSLMVDNQGFPIYSKIYDGNKSEPSTLNDILNQLEKDASTFVLLKKPVLIMDRGIATKKNIALIEEKGYSYTVINRSQTEKEFQKEFEEIKRFIDSNSFNIDIPNGWETVEDKQNVYIKKKVFEDKCFVLSVSREKAYKEQSMDSTKEKKFIEEIEKLKNSFKKRYITLPIKAAERIGRIKAKYPTISKYYEIDIKTTEDNKKISEINWAKKTQRQDRLSLTGCYVIETTQKDLPANEIWKQYVQLTRIESSFKDLKSELGLRPIYHQNAERTEAHLFIAVLAYHLLNAIEQSLKNHGDDREWKTIKKILSTHQRSTIILNGRKKKVYHIKVSSQPEVAHSEIYRKLKIIDTLKRKKSSVS